MCPVELVISLAYPSELIVFSLQPGTCNTTLQMLLLGLNSEYIHFPIPNHFNNSNTANSLFQRSFTSNFMLPSSSWVSRYSSCCCAEYWRSLKSCREDDVAKWMAERKIIARIGSVCNHIGDTTMFNISSFLKCLLLNCHLANARRHF